MELTELRDALRQAASEGVLGDLLAEAKKEPERPKTPLEELLASCRDRSVVHPLLLADVLEAIGRAVSVTWPAKSEGGE